MVSSILVNGKWKRVEMRSVYSSPYLSTTHMYMYRLHARTVACTRLLLWVCMCMCNCGFGAVGHQNGILMQGCYFFCWLCILVLCCVSRIIHNTLLCIRHTAGEERTGGLLLLLLLCCCCCRLRCCYCRWGTRWGLRSVTHPSSMPPRSRYKCMHAAVASICRGPHRNICMCMPMPI